MCAPRHGVSWVWVLSRLKTPTAPGFSADLSPVPLWVTGQRSSARQQRLSGPGLCDQLVWSAGPGPAQAGDSGTARRKLPSPPGLVPGLRLCPQARAPGPGGPGSPARQGWAVPPAAWPPPPSQGPQLPLEDGSSVLNNHMVGLSVGRTPVTRLPEPLEITFSHQRQPPVSPFLRPGSHCGQKGGGHTHMGPCTLCPAHPPKRSHQGHAHDCAGDTCPSCARCLQTPVHFCAHRSACEDQASPSACPGHSTPTHAMLPRGKGRQADPPSPTPSLCTPKDAGHLPATPGGGFPPSHAQAGPRGPVSSPSPS